MKLLCRIGLHHPEWTPPLQQRLNPLAPLTRCANCHQPLRPRNQQ